MKKESLLGVQLDDEVFLNVEVDIAALRQLGDNTLQAAGFAAQPGRQSNNSSISAGQLGKLFNLAAAFNNVDHVAGLHLVRGDVNALAINGEVVVRNELTGIAAGGSVAQTEDHVVQTALQQLEQVFTSLALTVEASSK